MVTTTNQDNDTQEVIVKLRCQIMAPTFRSCQYLRECPCLNSSFPSDKRPFSKLPAHTGKVICKTLTKKCAYNLWMRHFMDEGNDTENVEHAAFLVFSLSKFVFPELKNDIRKDVHDIAMKLASGIRIAIVPAMLASIYAGLRRLKESFSRSDTTENENFELCSFMHLGKELLRERFPKMRLKPNTIQAGEPRLVRGHNFEGVWNYAPGEMINVAKYDWQWRAYRKFVNHKTFNEFNRTDEKWVEIKGGNEQESKPFAMLIRHIELVGFEENIEEYMSYRIAMQFGMNQDVPRLILRFNESVKFARARYNRPWDQKVVMTIQLSHLNKVPNFYTRNLSLFLLVTENQR